MGYLEDSSGTEENNSSIREMRGLETNPNGATASSIFSCFKALLTESVDVKHIETPQTTHKAFGQAVTP